MAAYLHDALARCCGAKIPVHDNLKMHLMSRQADSLKNFIQIGQSWKTVLGSCKPIGPQDEIEFEALMAEVKEFVSWAKAKLGVWAAEGKHPMTSLPS